MKTLKYFFILFATLITACSESSEDTAKFSPYLTANIVPGQGMLPDVLLGKTTVKEIVEKFGTGKIILDFADEDIHFEHTYLNQITFRFYSEPLCKSEIGMISPAKIAGQILKEPAAFFATYPECAKMKLDTIKIKTAYKDTETHFRGALPSGIMLNDTLETAEGKDTQLKAQTATAPEIIYVKNPNPEASSKACEEVGPELCPTLPVLSKAMLQKPGLTLNFALQMPATYGSPLMLKEIILSSTVPKAPR